MHIPMAKAAHTDAEKFDEASRELAARIKSYPRMIVAGEITRELAHKRMAIMQEIAEDYRRRIELPFECK